MGGKTAPFLHQASTGTLVLQGEIHLQEVWWSFPIPRALRERGAAGRGALLYCFAVRNISMATKALLGAFVLLLLIVLLGISQSAEQTALH